MKILLHSPLHQSYFVYLMECMPEIEWFIEPEDDFQEGAIPRDHLEYSIVPKDTPIIFDAQIIVLTAITDTKFWETLQDFSIPPVFLTYWKQVLPKLEVKYPLISGTTCQSNTEYSNIRYSYVPPSKKLWNVNWIGDEKKVFIQAQSYLKPQHRETRLAKEIPILQANNIPLDIAHNAPRNIPWNEWQYKYIHDRVFYDGSDKNASFSIEEAMMIGMPVVVRNGAESAIMIRNGKDGISDWEEKDLVTILRNYIEDKSYAEEWGIRAKKRAKEIFDPQKTRMVFEDAIENAIKLYWEAKVPFERGK